MDEAGFTLRGVEARLAGVLERVEGNLVLVLPDPAGQRFYLYERLGGDSAGDAPGHAAAGEVLGEAARKRLEGLMAGRKRVRIHGPVHAHKGTKTPMAIGIEGLEEVSAAAHAPPGMAARARVAFPGSPPHVPLDERVDAC